MNLFAKRKVSAAKIKSLKIIVLAVISKQPGEN